jgi:hypothetical protein
MLQKCFLLVLVLALYGCAQPCSVPTQRFPQLRIVNAMPDQPVMKIVLKGKVISAAYPYPILDDFGYIGTYLDGSVVRAGDRDTLVVLSAESDTLIDTVISLGEHRHTLVILGKKSAPALEKILLLDDEIVQRDLSENLIRFVDAIPDLPAMDVYFQTTFAGHTPDLQLHYGDSLGYQRLTSAPGLTITAAGDTNNVIFSLPFPNHSGGGFFATIVLRGEKHPIGSEPTVETQVLSDQLPGKSFFFVKSFGARFVNATRQGVLSLMPRGPSDQGIRTNIPQQAQAGLINLPFDSVSDWAPFNAALEGSLSNGTVYWFFGTSTTDTLLRFVYEPNPFVRYTMIALDTSRLGSPQVLDSMIIADTISLPPTGISRLRIVNLSPDHIFSFTLNNQKFLMPRRAVDMIDVPAGVTSFALYDSKNLATPLETVNLNLPAGVPRTLFLMPDNTPGQVPYRLGLE